MRLRRHPRPASRARYSWQTEAINLWEKAGRRGIIEAVTGSGKTHVAIEALAQLYAQDPWLNTMITVPTLALVDQWYEKLRKRFPGQRVGRIGGKYNDAFPVPPLAYVTTIHAALNRARNLFEHCWGPRSNGQHKSFLIADECHHYVGAPKWKQILEPPHEWTYRMGLSATIDPCEIDGLGQIVKTYTFQEAHSDGLVPSFDLVNVGVDLTATEADDYFELSEKIGDQLRTVIQDYGDELRDVPDHRLFKKLQQLMGWLGLGNEPEIERLFLLLFQRAKIYYMAANKMDLARHAVMQFIESKRKVLVFFERIAAADQVNDIIPVRAATCLQGRLAGTPGMWCRPYHSGMNRAERDTILGEFRKRDSGALLACHCLDEGIDVPDVDGAILAASTQGARQRIQRIGRTLRRGDGGKRPIIMTLFAKGTGDEGATTDDRQTFRGVARIHDACAMRCPAVLAKLLGGRGARQMS